MVEDNPADVLLVKEALREHAVEADVEVINDGQQAYLYWDRFSSGQQSMCPDLVLLDINLPRRSGLDVLRRIRETPACSDLRVMVMSSSASLQDYGEAHSLGISQYFRKPMHFDEFMDLGRIVKSLGSDNGAVGSD